MMGFGYGPGYGPGFSPMYGILAMGGMGLFWLLVLGAIIWAVVYFSRQRTYSQETNRSIDILRERYARGEIDEEEYEHRLSRLK
ncbi:MAG: SHOCT domain-containing protein [Bacilli bacterium]